jgi:hypothetical protein
VNLPALDDNSIDVKLAYRVLADACLKAATMLRDPDTAEARADLKPVDICDVLVAYLLFDRDLRRSHERAFARGGALKHARRIAGEVLFAQSDSMDAIRSFVKLTRTYPAESLDLALGPVSSAGIAWTNEMADSDDLGQLTLDVYVGARIKNALPRATYLGRRVRNDVHLSSIQREFAVELSEGWTGTLTELIDTAMTLRP